MGKSNNQVKDAFFRGEAARSRHLVSTGTSLLSYGWWEVARYVDGGIMRRNGRNYSMTTATRHQIWAGTLSSIETPVGQGEMNIGYGNMFGDGAHCPYVRRKPRVGSTMEQYRHDACHGCKAKKGWDW